MSFDAPRASGHHQLTSIRLKQGLESPVLQTESDTQLFQTHSRRRRPDCLRFATCYRTRQDRGPGLWVCNLELNNVDFRESREATVQSRSGVVEALFRKQTSDLLAGEVSVPRVNLRALQSISRRFS